MTKEEMKTLKPGDIVYDKKHGHGYEFLEVCRYELSGCKTIYDLRLKPCDGGEEVFINNKRMRK